MEVVERGSTDRNEELDERVAVMKREVDALQIQMAEKARPWWKQIPVLLPLIISLGALSFSVWTDQKSENRLERRDEHDARVELTGLIQRLQALPKENFELQQNYGDQPALNTQINTENLVLSRQAADLINELEGDVSAMEYYSVGYALSYSGLHVEASNLLTQGLAVARDSTGALSLLRQDALEHFALGDLEGGRTRWREAMDISDKYPGRNATTVAAETMYTEMRWAAAELAQHECPAALRHITAAKQYISKLEPEHPWTGWIGQVHSAETDIDAQCP